LPSTVFKHDRYQQFSSTVAKRLCQAWLPSAFAKHGCQAPLPSMHGCGARYQAQPTGTVAINKSYFQVPLMTAVGNCRSQTLFESAEGKEGLQLGQEQEHQLGQAHQLG
jgi:hypothetical protein